MSPCRYWNMPFVGFAFWASSAAASDARPLLSYVAPWECPNRDHFWRQLRARSTRLTRMKPDEPGVSVEARITGVDSRYVGRVRVEDSEGRREWSSGGFRGRLVWT